MSLTLVDLQENMNYYSSMAAKQEIFIVQDGKIMARLVNPNEDGISATKSLFGILLQTMLLEEVMKEREKEIWKKLGE